MGKVEVFKTFNLPIGLILALKVVEGELRAGAKININGKIATVKSLEVDRQTVELGAAGMDVGALVEGVEVGDVDLAVYEFE